MTWNSNLVTSNSKLEEKKAFIFIGEHDNAIKSASVCVFTKSV